MHYQIRLKQTIYRQGNSQNVKMSELWAFQEPPVSVTDSVTHSYPSKEFLGHKNFGQKNHRLHLSQKVQLVLDQAFISDFYFKNDNESFRELVFSSKGYQPNM